MTEKLAIKIAAGLGAIVLVLAIVVVRPFSRFEEQYPMTAVSGSAVSGEGVTVDTAASGSATESASGAAVSGAAAETFTESVTGSPLVNASGNTLSTRVLTPEGFSRTEEASGSLGDFLRNYKMKKDGSPVLLYNKEEKSNQDAHIAVFKLPLENEDLQQCADSVMRVYAEYFRKTEQFDRIQFSLNDVFKAVYTKWREGYRIREDADSFYWSDEAQYDPSNANFKKFMRIVFAYSGTYALEGDSESVALSDVRIGDIFIHAGSPGHVVMVVDMCESADGRKAFLLAQGYMPAQQFQLLKNPLHTDDPWYYVDEVSYPFVTPEYTFDEECLMRPTY